MNSKVEHYKIQNDGDNSYHVGTTQVHQEKDSRFSDTTISWGGAITRNDLNSVLTERIRVSFLRIVFAYGKQHVDNHTLADHKMPNCYSNELCIKESLTIMRREFFNGKIMVREDAQKTNAYQSNNNILLSDDATILFKTAA